MKSIFVSVALVFCILPSVSYSDNIMTTVARDKVSSCMKSLREGDPEGCYKVRQGIDAYGEEEQKKINSFLDDV